MGPSIPLCRYFCAYACIIFALFSSDHVFLLDIDSEHKYVLGADNGFFYQTGPAVYRNRTVFEGATPELVRDFFWDDEFRRKWDPMLAYVKILQECHQTGTMIVHWIKKVCGTVDFLTVISWFCSANFLSNNGLIDDFICTYLQFPFFCSDREYIIGRRIWEAGKNYYCVTKV